MSTILVHVYTEYSIDNDHIHAFDCKSSNGLLTVAQTTDVKVSRPHYEHSLVLVIIKGHQGSCKQSLLVQPRAVGHVGH